MTENCTDLIASRNDLYGKIDVLLIEQKVLPALSSRHKDILKELLDYSSKLSMVEMRILHNKCYEN